MEPERLNIKPKSATAEVQLLASYLGNKPIPDPNYGGIRGFENTFLDKLTSNSAKSAL
ncbi:hypothetical protein BDN71DRAFT_1446487 [Pleurotus eryngii]|uniref:Uncharacterized protein n=1 Tax=Pleurotus eryngii TaxID=5323 RepID=A0A9P5ZZ15_PLEER|nr:hypothetical protein BDN71DRAFT_1446487 [Pleurotus eryngii]